jgi:hypothetical protein
MKDILSKMNITSFAPEATGLCGNGGRTSVEPSGSQSHEKEKAEPRKRFGLLFER